MFLRGGPIILIPYITLIYPLYSLIKPHNPKGPFKGISFSPLMFVVLARGFSKVVCALAPDNIHMTHYELTAPWR